MINSDFHPALPKPVKWSTGENRFDQTGKNPTSLSLFVPLESVHAFANYLMNLADDDSRHKSGKIWDYSAKAEVEVPGIYINGKGRDGRDGGAFGTINPASTKADAAALNEVPF